MIIQFQATHSWTGTNCILKCTLLIIIMVSLDRAVVLLITDDEKNRGFRWPLPFSRTLQDLKAYRQVGGEPDNMF